MGWRSWNAFGNRITQTMMLEASEAMVAKNRTVGGHSGQLSLCDMGYCSVGVDEGWAPHARLDEKSMIARPPQSIHGR